MSDIDGITLYSRISMTGYTSIFSEKEPSLKEFAFICARAFGACISMKDEPVSKMPPLKVKPDTYHKEEAKRMEASLKRLEKLSEEKLAKNFRKSLKETIKQAKRGIKKNQDLKKRLRKMVRRVNAWNPPESVFCLKKFMLEQLESSIYYADDSFDRRSIDAARKKLELVKNPEALKKLREEAVKEVRGEIESSLEHQKKENERAANATKWLRELYSSLP